MAHRDNSGDGSALMSTNLFLEELRNSLSAAQPDGAQSASWDPLEVNFERQWGWADVPPCLFDDTRAEEAERPHPSAFAEALSTSRAYHSPHCATALSEHCGLQQLHDGMDSVCIMGLGNEELAEGVRNAVKQRINAAWATEAIKQGVQHSKSGAYEEAHKCYAKAMELHPANADAFVARGAAFANQGHFDSAIADFEHALSLDAHNANADKYLQAVRQRAASRRAELQAQRQDTPHRVAHGASGAGPPTALAAASIPEVPRKAGTAAAGEANAQAYSAAALKCQIPALAQQSPNAQEACKGQGEQWRRQKRSSSRASSDGSSSSSQSSEADAEHDNGKPGDVHRALQLVLEARRKAKGKKREKHKKPKHKKKKKKHR